MVPIMLGPRGGHGEAKDVGGGYPARSWRCDGEEAPGHVVQGKEPMAHAVEEGACGPAAAGGQSQRRAFLGWELKARTRIVR